MSRPDLDLPRPTDPVIREAIAAILAERRAVVTIGEIGRILERRGLIKLQPEFALYYDSRQHREIAGHVLAMMEAGELARLLIEP
jgi:hypothetical protein